MKTKTTQNILLFLLAFLGLGAIGGGAVLIISPMGALLGMPVSMLERSPFNSFLIPGIILFTMLGLAPCLLIPALLKKPACKLAEKLNCFPDMHWSWTYSVYVAFALIIWIQFQMVFLQTVHWLHTFYMLFAVGLIYVALLPQVRNLYKR
ncbi:MAG: hypothetical protein JWQ54_641 [Mucilaginibacter sp.]|nr:hypothetical protein [Mucilaginibacter sp.]